MEHYVFVYGTLKKGFGNHRYLSNSKFIKQDLTEDKYHMYSMGAFPAVTTTLKTHYIQGELYQVDDAVMDNLDTLEDEGYLYKRKLVKMKNFNELVWMYIIFDKKWYDITNKEHVEELGNIQRWTK